MLRVAEPQVPNYRLAVLGSRGVNLEMCEKALLIIRVRIPVFLERYG